MVRERLGRVPAALNPAIYLVSIVPGAFAYLAGAPLGPIAAATLGVVLLQHGINVLNDVTDWKRGADVEKSASWVRVLGLAGSSRHGWGSLALGTAVGLATLFIIGKIWIALVALPLVALGCLYNEGKRPLAYGHHGEWVTALCYGPGVFGCLWLVGTSRVDLTAVLGSLAFAALAAAVLLSHQPPQVLTDALAGKRSFAVRHGVKATLFWSRALYTLGLLALLVIPLEGKAVQAAGTLVLLVLTWRRRPHPGHYLLGIGALVLVMLPW